MKASIDHIETVFGHALASLCEKLDVKQKLTLLVLPENAEGSGFQHFNDVTGVLRMSEDIFRGDPHIPWYSIARLAMVASYKEKPGETHVIDAEVELRELQNFEKSLLEDGEDGIIQSQFLERKKTREPDGEICSAEEALSLVGSGFVNTIHEPPGAGRGAVSYQWKDGAEFMVRSESTMTRDADGNYHFTDTEYRKIPRN